MLEIRNKSAAPATPGLSLTLPFQDRQRSRLRVELSSGQEALLLMPRGSVLRGGDTLSLSDGRVVRVVAAPELVSTVRAESARALARVAYHLGNRHVPLEVGEGFVRYQHDHVLDGMVRELGLMVMVEDAPFEPEGGAYGKHSHSSGGAHGHSHSLGGVHSHEDAHSHSHSHEDAHEDEDEDEDEHEDAHEDEHAHAHSHAHSHAHAHAHEHEHEHAHEHEHEDAHEHEHEDAHEHEHEDEHAHARAHVRVHADGHSRSARGGLRAVELVRLDDGAVVDGAGERAR